jgi:rubredoxin
VSEAPLPDQAPEPELTPPIEAQNASETPAATPEATEAAEAAAAPAAAPQEDPDTHRFECRSCGFVYDPGEGIKKLAIAPGTPFSALDAATFRCPVCRSPVKAFKDIGPRNKPSGFEENLGYGLGVNQLTPGQKNVLIFGGFALAIAFFLSLYSLR